MDASQSDSEITAISREDDQKDREAHVQTPLDASTDTDVKQVA